MFIYMLAGLIYIGRALLSEWAVPAAERSTIRDAAEQFARICKKWLYKVIYSFISYILSLLLYGKKIARETGSRLTVSWSK
jgi:hypothetical protein